MREYVGLHDLYDGVVQDLSPAGVTAGVARLGEGEPEADPYDDAQLRAYERGVTTALGDLEDHRRNPLWHLANLDVACYDREYAPAEERAAARRRHLAAWPDAVDAAIEALDRVPAAVAEALLPGVRGLAEGVDDEAARAAQQRFQAHVEEAARSGDPDASLGAGALARLMGDPEALAVDLGRLAVQADGERDRLLAMLRDACEQLEPGVPLTEVVAGMTADHAPDIDTVYAEARALIDEAAAFTVERDLLRDLGGECRVGPAPPSRRWAMAMMSGAAPFEPDAPSWYYISPPDPEWSAEDRESWLAVFNRTTLPAITVHEVTPGHFAHARMIRLTTSDVRRALQPLAFVEGWAHYVEELFAEEGFRHGDPRYVAGMCIEALIRVTRLAVAIGVHTGAMTMDDAVARFEQDAFLTGEAARSEAGRATYDPAYGRYTWGKLAIREARDEARRRWGSGYTHRRFHDALLGLGSPALGLLGNALG
ncbi:MAG: DUF885 family protein [Actinobacteria bacterium]|nr:DUF885 family protein [Actinomycetota bacterium]